MIGTIMCIIFIIINIYNFLWVLEHSKTLIFNRSNTNVNCTCSMSCLQNFNSWLKIMSIVKNVPKNISPWISISCHLDWPFRRKPYLLSNCKFVWHSCQWPNKSSPCKVNVWIPFFIWRMINNCQWIFTDRILIIPIQSSHMDGLSTFSCFAPDSCNSACSLNKLWEDV